MPSLTTTLLSSLLLLLAAVVYYTLFHPRSQLLDWLRKKNYQYEVTFSLYMLTPMEKFIFNSVLFLTLGLLALATVLYLPDHVAVVGRRGYYYFVGDGHGHASKASEAVEGVVRAQEVVREGLSGGA